jgi:hypothetical protein
VLPAGLGRDRGRSDHGPNIPSGGEAASGYTRTNSHTCCTQPILVPPSASTERVGEQAYEIVVRRATRARVCRRAAFWGAYSRLLASSLD